MTHSNLITVAEKWLLNSKGCGFVFTDLRTINTETPDAIGFRSGMSILVEVKVSRADFHADKKKIFRRKPLMGMGTFRFFMCPKGIIRPDDLPDGWGLVWVNEKGKPRQQVGPKGNIWSARSMDAFRFGVRNTEAEMNMMYSALRRLHKRGVLPQIYDNPFATSEGGSRHEG